MSAPEERHGIRARCRPLARAGRLVVASVALSVLAVAAAGPAVAAGSASGSAPVAPVVSPVAASGDGAGASGGAGTSGGAGGGGVGGGSGGGAGGSISGGTPGGGHGGGVGGGVGGTPVTDGGYPAHPGGSGSAVPTARPGPATPARGGPILADTGTQTAAELQLAGALLLAGTGSLVVGRRRPHRR